MKLLSLMIRVCGTSALVLLLSTAAQAGDDSDCSIGEVAFPQDGATDVPINPVLLGNGDSSYDYGTWSTFAGIADEAENEIDTIVDFTYAEGYCDFTIYRPLNDLEPNTTYVIYYGDTTGNTFVTGDSRDDDPPVITVSDEPVDGNENVYTYTSDEELAFTTYKESISLGSIGHLQRAEMTGELRADRDTVFYDWAGNNTVVEAWVDTSGGDDTLDGDDTSGANDGGDSGCSITGAGAAGNTGWIRLALSLFFSFSS